MINDEFMELWCDKDLERTVVITDQFEGIDGLAVIISFPPNRVAVGRIELFPDIMNSPF